MGAPVLPPTPPHPELFSREELKAMMRECGLVEPIFSGEELRALLLEFEEAQVALFTPDGLEATALAAGDETEAPAPLPPAVARCSDRRKKRIKRPPPPPLRAPRPSKTKRRRLPSRRRQNMMVATRILERKIDSPDPSRRRRTALWCQCEELPWGSPPCALHQAAPERSWMTTQGGVPDMGGAGEVVVPKLRQRSRKTVTMYMRWRRGVWMPSRFFLEHAGEQAALEEERELLDCAAPMSMDWSHGCI